MSSVNSLSKKFLRLLLRHGFFNNLLQGSRYPVSGVSGEQDANFDTKTTQLNADRTSLWTSNRIEELWLQPGQESKLIVRLCPVNDTSSEVSV